MAEAEKYEVLAEIGHGSFGVIRKVRRIEDGLVLCRKEINYVRMSSKEREQLHAELMILSSLRHPNIVRYYHKDHLKSSMDLHIYMELCHGDLSTVVRSLRTKNQFAEEDFVWTIFTQTVLALYRCHYGVDPPEVGKILSKPVKSVSAKKELMILHRDIKPENIFLDGDGQVKLGDFGLSKMMQSHDFASTYVGTPYYMSPEIICEERYTLKSDIWSLGCVIYELCARSPPFNATSHLGLCQKIREGKIAALPAVYSSELRAVINSCLQVNPHKRPETADLLNLPYVRLVRKEREVVEISRSLKQKEAELDTRIASMRKDLEAGVRREWEVKAQLEIDRRVKAEMSRLGSEFEAQVQRRVGEELSKRGSTSSSDASSAFSQEDLASTMTSVSIASPEVVRRKSLKRAERTPFTRAQTISYVRSPQDTQMAEASPMSISCLSLSPRKTHLRDGNIFNIASDRSAEVRLANLSDSEPEEDSSPTRRRGRPSFLSRAGAPRINSSTALSRLGRAPEPAQPEPKDSSPNRRLSRIPASISAGLGLGGLAQSTATDMSRRKKSISDSTLPAAAKEMRKVANHTAGRTLVELNNARNIPGPMGPPSPIKNERRRSINPISDTACGVKIAARLAETSPMKRALWDPETTDEMPSPFLVRSKTVAGIGRRPGWKGAGY